MYIGNYYQGIMRLFSGMHGRGIHANMPLFGGASRRPNAGGRNTLEDLLTGHYKNSHGVEGMVITKGSNRKRTMPVSDEMKQFVYNDVKNAFYKYNGMSGDNEAEQKRYSAVINNYLKTIKKEDRSATSWTLGQMKVNFANKVASAVKEKVPGWTYGKPIPSDVLDEIFVDEGITSTVSGEVKGLDMRI